VAVALLQRHDNLSEHSPDEFLFDGNTAKTQLILALVGMALHPPLVGLDIPFRFGLFDKIPQVATFAEFHHDIDATRCLVDDTVIVSDYEGMAQFT
jgi:hypothetical protein